MPNKTPMTDLMPEAMMPEGAGMMRGEGTMLAEEMTVRPATATETATATGVAGMMEAGIRAGT